MDSISAPQKASNYDEIFMQSSLQFAESLKDLRTLKKQLYSAAEYFESSYDKDDRQMLVMESSKDYATKAVVSTVDHLGSVADKLSKFLDEKANEFSATDIRISCIQQKLSKFQGFIDVRGVSQHTLIVEAPKHHKQYIVAGIYVILFSDFFGSKLTWLYPDNLSAKAVQAARLKPQPPLSRKGHPMVPSDEPSQNHSHFPFTRAMSKKDTGKRSVSPLSFPLKRSGSSAYRSVSPTPSYSNQQMQWQSPSEPRRAMSVCRIGGVKREGQIVESHTKRSKNLFRALLNAHRSRKENHKLQTMYR
ncbi:protein ABIL2-like isoform X1 [Salvia splendens]|uniref:protein ABIL2-like isoform X1 n=1 Tax=Salvia splendens TaxID=180675 RepID=UPI001C26C047|nr:protein ABIL2-like isoform X1 [Salvia splendens]